MHYTAIRNAAVDMVQTAKRKYEFSLAKRPKDHPKKYYAYVQPKRALTDGVGPLQTEEHSVATDDNIKAVTLSL
ncbi:unnamed protein product [Echinostoma caproni]|uniref:60S ribosomal protein L17 n=1 Tax=Echinostoma caproni TaxID=27848 RepID=A0A183BFV5_9TREM|nr:unnamed protein product [Echinostoma caproni]